jgi:hypothetical protein
VTGEWRKLHNEELNDLRVIKSRGMRWAGHVARMEEGIGAHKVLVGGNQRERDHWGDQDVGGRIILRCIFRKWDGGCGEWMELAQDTDRWRPLVSTVMNCGVVP